MVDCVRVACVRGVVRLSIRWFRDGVVRSCCSVFVFGGGACFVLFAWCRVCCACAGQCGFVMWGDVVLGAVWVRQRSGVAFREVVSGSEA